MNRLDYYRKNNKERYETADYTYACEIKALEALQLKCISCMGTYSDAYKCKNTYCPLYIVKKDKMKRPHTASEAFLLNRKNIQDLY